MHRLSREQAGFTLVELVVVVLFIAILMAIAVPTFLGFKRRTDDVAATSTANLAKGLTDEDSYAPVTLGALGPPSRASRSWSVPPRARARRW
jgi:type IV pilus assembly protein PilA